MSSKNQLITRLKGMRGLTGKFNSYKNIDKYAKRNAMIAMAVARGAKPVELAVLLGMSRERIRQIVSKVDIRNASWQAR